MAGTNPRNVKQMDENHTNSLKAIFGLLSSTKVLCLEQREGGLGGIQTSTTRKGTERETERGPLTSKGTYLPQGVRTTSLCSIQSVLWCARLALEGLSSLVVKFLCGALGRQTYARSGVWMEKKRIHELRHILFPQYCGGFLYFGALRSHHVAGKFVLKKIERSSRFSDFKSNWSPEFEIHLCTLIIFKGRVFEVKKVAVVWLEWHILFYVKSMENMWFLNNQTLLKLST